MLAVIRINRLMMTHRRPCLLAQDHHAVTFVKLHIIVLQAIQLHV